jgi:integrase
MTFSGARDIKKLKPSDTAYYASDTEISGLQLRVAPDGSMTWSVRYRIGRRQRRLTLGNAAVIPLGDNQDKHTTGARTLARQALQQAQQQVDPAETKRERREADTVGDFADVYIETYAKIKKKSWRDDNRHLRIEVLPHWGRRLMRDITRHDVQDLIDAIAARPAPIRANRVRAMLHKMFNIAFRKGVVELNVVTATDRPGVEQQRDRVLTVEEIRTFWTACEALPVEMGAAFRLRLITAQRAGEVFDATWSEMDLKNGWWTIPKERAKNGLSHHVPLSPMAVKILKALKTDECKPADYILAGARGARQQAEAAATFMIKDFHGHDLRRTAASLMTGSGTPRLIVAKILNHKESGVTAVYDRHSYDGDKRIALDAWARTLTTILRKKDSNVVTFARA